MKKILLLLFFNLIFLPKIVFASSDSTTAQVNFDYTTRMYKVNEWLYNTSKDYLNTYTDNIDYYNISVKDNWIYSGSTLTSIQYHITLYGSDTSFGIVSDYRSSGYSGIRLANGSNYNVYAHWSIYLNPNDNEYYSSTTFNNTNKLVSLNDNVRTSYTTYDNYLQLSSIGVCSLYSAWLTINYTGCGHANPLTASLAFPVYKSNLPIVASPYGNVNRNIKLYDPNNEEVIDTYSIGDIFPDYYTIFDKPAYLTGYKKISLTPSDRYIILSDITKGSVYIPRNAWDLYGGRLSYYDKELENQPYTSYIENGTNTFDGLYVRQDFDISSYPGADFVMFSKYIYWEGIDNISYDIYVPDSSYDSGITITPNNTGGNDFEFNYKDSNGDIQTETFENLGSLQNTNPLLGSMFENFSSNTFGLTSIITAPLSLIYNITSNTCNSLVLPLPFVNSSITIPCMTELYSTYFGTLFTLYQTITFGLIAYWVCIRVFNLVKDFKNPDHDEIEVLDL